MIDSVIVQYQSNGIQVSTEFVTGKDDVDYIQVNPDMNGVRIIYKEGKVKGIFGCSLILVEESFAPPPEPVKKKKYSVIREAPTQ